ncbi:MAG: RNA polymerase sigma factor [Patescibacteria group bacterium]
MDLQENSAIQSCQAGETAAFGLLYDRYLRKIYNFIYYKTHHKETAEDLTSKTFIKALGSIGRFEFKKGTFSAWLYQIARYTVIDHYRAQKYDINIDDVWDLGEETTIPQDLDTANQLREVKKLLQKLPSAERDIIILRVWNELSYQEIASLIGKSEANCRLIFSRAIRKIRQTGAPLGLLLLFLSLR